MVSACLREKHDYYYIIISYYEEGKRRQIWKSTGLKVRGNKRKAEQLLADYQKRYSPEEQQLLPEQEEQAIIKSIQRNDVLFGDYMQEWCEAQRGVIEESTYCNYKRQINRAIVPYFNQRRITLQAITAQDINDFYKTQVKKVSAGTVKHYHSNIRKALQDAYVEDKILCNPADKVKLPQADPFIGDYYNQKELQKLLLSVQGTQIEFPVYMAVYYGLRRSEISGLQWSAVDFDYKTITIRRTIVGCFVDGKYTCVEKERTKTKKSLRTLPLMPVIEQMLLRMKDKQEAEKKFFGNSYKGVGYIYVHEDGEYYNPNYITCEFIKHLKRKSFRHIRFHDLRHSCATLMRHEGIKMEDIQKWLGHSQLATTEKIYAHFEEEQHITSAEIISKKLSFE